MVRFSNKKGNLYSILFNAIFFLIMAGVILFVGYTMFSIGNDYIAIPLGNITGQANYSQNITGAIGTVGEQYHNTNLIFFDYGFVLAYSVVFLIGLFLAYKTRALNYFNWFAGLLYVNMILLLVLGVSLMYTNWLLDMVIKVMPGLNIQLPMTTYILDKMGVIFLCQSCIYFLVNVIDFDFITIQNRKKKEQQALDNEIV